MKSATKAATYGGAALGIGLLVYVAFFHKSKHEDAVAAPAGSSDAAALQQLSSQMNQLQQQASQPQYQPAPVPVIQQGTNPYLPGYNPALAAINPALATSAVNTMTPPTQLPQSGYQWILGAGPTGPLWQQEPAPTPPGQHWAQTGTAFYLAANQPGISYSDYRPASPSLIVAATHA